MRSVEELIAAGRVPADTKSADGSNAYPAGWPIFTQLKDQVKYDWDYLPSDRVKILRADPTYKAALVQMLEPPESATPPAASSVAVVEPPAPTGPSLEEEIQGNSTPVPVVQEPVVEEEIEVAGSGVPPVGTKVEYPFGTVEKTTAGWEARVDLHDGSGTQVFKGVELLDVVATLLQAQAHATQKIRSQEEEKRAAVANAEPDIKVERKRLAPRSLTADEQFEFAEAISSGDATRINRAMAKRDQIVLGGPVEEVVGQVNATQDQLEYQAWVNTARAFIKQHPEYAISKEYGDKMDVILNEKGWAYTVRNLNKVLAILEEQGDFPTKVSTADAEPAIPVPTSTKTVAAPAAAVAVPPAPAPAPRPAPPAQTPEAQAQRLRPGSASTGMSPRQASVRPGATPPAPSVVLTAEEYNRMSVSDTRRKYKTDLGFKAAVDKLIAEGKI